MSVIHFSSCSVSFLCVLFQVIQCIQTGQLLERPLRCAEQVYDLMLGCWKRTPAERMTMQYLFNQLNGMQEQSATVYLEVIG